MLSRIDITHELGKGIGIFPFNGDNIKENSINLSVSKYAWTLSKGFIKKNDDRYVLCDESELGGIKFEEKGRASFKEDDGKTKVVALPNSTTLIETKEVIGVDGRIGGSYHSKVGIVSIGLGHIGTMLGPNFAGHSLIAIHNHTERVITLNEGETFVSVVFHYLDTKINVPNPTINGHLEKLSEYGVKTTSEDIKYLSEDWKVNLRGEGNQNSICLKLKNDKSYQEWAKNKLGLFERFKYFFKVHEKFFIGIISALLSSIISPIVGYIISLFKLLKV
jgi:deoxycytidine triphosphate deaminase